MSLDPSALAAELEIELAESDEFWRSFGVDSEQGGFMCALAHDGALLSGDKYIWYQGRGLWVYSRLYRLHGNRPEHLEVATKTYHFLIDHFLDAETGLYHIQTDRAGGVIQPAAPGSVLTTGYGSAFAAEGLVEYHRATGDAAALEHGLAAFRRFQVLIDDDARVSDETHIPHLEPGTRSLGHQMICVSFTRQWLEPPAILAGADLEWIEQLNQRTVGLIMDKFYHPGFGLLSEALAPDYSRPDDPNEDFAYIGHGIEVLWMVMAEALRRGDQQLYTVAAARFRRAVDVATDPVYGGAFRGMTSVREHRFMVDEDCKVKWVQDEVLIGCMLLLEHGPGDGDLSAEAFPAPADRGWAPRTFQAYREYVAAKFSLKSRGLPYVLVGGDREVAFRENYVNKGQPGALNRKENYHHPRALILMLEACQRMAGGEARQ